MLALDTCLQGCSAALFDGGQPIAARFEMMERGHAERLPVMVDELFRAAGLLPSALSGVAVTRGPGTFTGIRIGLSYARGLGLALGLPVTGIGTLSATAVPHRGESARLLVAHTAGATGQCYVSLLDGATLAVHQPPALLTPEQAAAMAGEALVIGTAAQTVLAAGHGLTAATEHHLPDAARFGAFAFSLSPADHPAEPLYLRAADAKPSAPPSLAVPQLRAATLADVATLTRLHQFCFSPGWSAEMISSALALPGALALVLELAGRPYGFVQAQWIAGEAEVNTLCVPPLYRRQGFGRMLMEGLIGELRARETARLFLEVAADNEAALLLYRSLGFRQTGLRKGYYARPAGAADAITMTLIP